MPSDTASEHARQWLRQRADTPEFCAACCEFLIRGFDIPSDLWTLPLVRPTQERLSARLFVWPAEYENIRHEHSHWSVAAVLLEQIQVLIFREGTDAEPSAQFTGKAGDVGLLKAPCIHQIRNVGASPAVTFHIFETTEEEADALEGLSDTVWHGDKVDRYRVGLKRRAEIATVEMIKTLPADMALPLLHDMFGKVGRASKLAVSAAVAAFSPSAASLQLDELAEAVEPGMKDRLTSLATRLRALG